MVLGGIAAAALAVGLLRRRSPTPPRLYPSPPGWDADTDWSRRKAIFTPGARYRVKQKAHGGFEAGEIVIFERVAYSHYDNTHYFEFHSESGAGKSWLLNDNDPLDTWQQIFELIS